MPRWTFAVAAAAALLHYGPELLESYPPGLDESWMLQAGYRLHEGRGFTSHLHSAWTDLSAPTYRHLYHWTPLHGWMFASLLAVTGGAESALRAMVIIKLLAAVAGMVGWLRLGQRVLPGEAELAAFAVGLSGLFFAGGADAGPPHLFFWAMLPWAITAVLDGCEQSRLLPILWAGVLAALAVGFRYHAAYLVPGLGLATLLLWRGEGGRSRLDRWLAGAAVGVPSLLMLVAIAAYNAAGQAPTSWASVTLRQPNQWENLLYREPLSFVTAFGFGVEAALVKLRPSWERPAWYWLPWDALLLGVGAWALLSRRADESGNKTSDTSPTTNNQQPTTPEPQAPDPEPTLRSLPFLARRRDSARFPPEPPRRLRLPDAQTPRPQTPTTGPHAASNLAPSPSHPAPAFLWATACLIAALLAMLAVVSYRGTPEPGWMPIGERRLYSELLPAVGLMWVLILGQWVRRDRVGLIVVGLLTATVALPIVRPIFRTARQDVKRLREVARVGVGAEPPTVGRVRQLAAAAVAEHPDAVPIVFDTDTGVLPVLRIDDAVRTEQFFVPEHLTTSGSSRPLFVMVVVRHARGKPDFWPTHLARAYAEYFGLDSRGLGDADPEVEIYAGHVLPYRPTTRPQRR